MASRAHRVARPIEDPERARRRSRRRTWYSLAALTIISVAIFVIARTNYIAREIERTIRSEVRRQSGLQLDIARMGFSWRSLAVRAEGIELRHPTQGRLARVDTLTIRPAFTSLLHRQIHVSSIAVDGGRLELRFRGNQLLNGPTVPPPTHSSRPPDPDLPFGDIAVSDMSVHIEHDQVGTLDLASVDVDVHKVNAHRILIGLLAQRGGLRNNPCFAGPIGHVEARAELTDLRVLRIALAHVDAAPMGLHVREAMIPLDFRGPIRADLDVSGPLSRITCPIPRQPGSPPIPGLHGTAIVTLNGSGDIATKQFQATGRVQVSRAQMEMNLPERTFLYSLGDAIDASFTANQDTLTVTSLRLNHSGATATSPGTRPDRPIVVSHLFDHPVIDGHLDVVGFDLERLCHDMSVTFFARVQWTVNASVELHGDIWRFAEMADPHHPALVVDVNADTRNFAILKWYHQWLPQEPVIQIPHGLVTGQIVVNPEQTVFRNLVANFGHSRAEIGSVTVRQVHVDGTPDVWIEGGHAENVHLEDLGHIAGIPIGGQASITVQGGGTFFDPIITGEGHARNLMYNNLPLGDYDTRFASPWRFSGLHMRADFPAVDGRAGRSTFAIRNAYMDFHRYAVESGAHIESENFFLPDFYHMFKFENDPVFAPYTGQTMPRCRSASQRRVAHGSSPREVPCVDPSDPLHHDPRRPHAPPGVDSGWLSTDVYYVVGRPGDDREGVMEVDFTARDLFVNGFDEPVSHLDTHLRYSWLVRRLGYRGTRQFIEYARGRYGGGTIEASGNVDLGGQMHFTGNVRNVQIGESFLLAGKNITGLADAAGVLEGSPVAQRWTLDADLRGIAMSGRNIGDVSLHVREGPDGAASNDPVARPPRPRWTLDATALGGALHVNGAMVVPWRATVWEDVDHHPHTDWDRHWAGAETTGVVELTRTLDLLPLAPIRDTARFGADAYANVRARIQLERVLLGSLSGDMRDVDARLIVDQLDVRAQGLRFALAEDNVLAACIHGGTYWVEPGAAQSNAACATVPARLRPRRASLRVPDGVMPSTNFVGPEGTHFSIAGGGTLAGRLGLMVHGDFDIARFASLVPGVNWARGMGQFDVNIAGNTANPLFTGALEVDHAAVAAQVLPNPVQDINLRVRLDGSRIVLDRANAQFASSSIDLSNGVIHLHGRDIDRVDVPVVVRNLSLVPQPGVEVALDTDARISWSPGDELPLVSGDITLTRARYTRSVNMSQDPSGNASVAGSESAETPYDPRNNNLRLDLTVHAREPIRVTNNLFDGEIVIAEGERQLHVRGTDQRVGVIGTLNVARGRVFLRGNDFEIRRGRIDFDNPERIEPNFDVNAQAEIRRSSNVARNQWRIDLHGYGTPERFSLDMTSEPALSREDIALLMLFRMTRAELDQITSSGGGGLSGVGVEALATATGLDRTVRQAIPIIDEFRIGSAYSQRSGGTVPQVSVGRRINDRVRVGATVNTTDRSEIRATGDIRVFTNTGVQVGWDNIYDSLGSQLGNFGADIRWRLEFE